MVTTTIGGDMAGRNSYGAEAHAVGDAGSGVSWGAIFAGATAASALALILLVLGVGLGFSSVSPWTTTSRSAALLGGAAIVWILFTQIAASALGGYLAGRLRARWSVHTDEVYFRDTAHGFVAWAVATLVSAALLTSAIGSIVGSVAQAGGEAVKGAAGAASGMAGVAAKSESASSDTASPTSYFVDSLFRGNAAALQGAASAPADAQTRAEVARIFVNDLGAGQMGADDVRYIGQLVARGTGMAPADAEKRVGDVFKQTSTAINEATAKAKQVADDARKAAAYASLWIFVGLLAGAFFASFAALFGGRRRDAIS